MRTGAGRSLICGAPFLVDAKAEGLSAVNAENRLSGCVPMSMKGGRELGTDQSEKSAPTLVEVAVHCG